MRKIPLTENSPADRPDCLEKAGLVYVSDKEPGIRRVRRGRGFSYQLPDGSLLDDPVERQRIKTLALPPAYHDVWICARANGHLQATGYDARGRKQYFYHAEWQALRSQQKFGDLLHFAESLPIIRRRVDRDLRTPSDEARFLLAALVVLLDETHLRIGSRSYAKENRTYGATTLLKQHLSLEGERAEIRFRAKGGKRIIKRLKSPRLQRILEEIADLPGRELFSWRDEAGLHRVESSQLNAYLSEVAGIAISAKTFRTWGGSLAAFRAGLSPLRQGQQPRVKDMCQSAAKALHNTSSVCRTSYVHPAILSLAELDDDQERRNLLARLDRSVPKPGLYADEARLVAFLREDGEDRKMTR